MRAKRRARGKWRARVLVKRHAAAAGIDPARIDDVVMAQSGQNQSRAAEWLGLNRNTLRKKLLEHELLK